MSNVTTSFKSNASRSAHPQHPASTALAQDSGSIVASAGPGKGTQKLINGAQSGATKEGEVSMDFN